MITSHILMVRPANFAYNPQTAVNNVFQQLRAEDNIHTKALEEFDTFVNLLKQHNVNVTVVQDTPTPHTPDAVFPNNWITSHEDGTITLYPMFAPNRRLERSKNVLNTIEENFFIRTTLDLTNYENKNSFLEGTGSMVFDRDDELAYACISPRTHPTVLYDFCDAMGYSPILFEAFDHTGTEIYHTNVMMCLAEDYVVICLEAIRDPAQKKMLINKFEETNKLIIDITIEQMFHFAGNMLQIASNTGEKILVMSSKAYNSLTKEQLNIIQGFNPILHAPLDTIENMGGGSARCMITEIYLLPKKEGNIIT